MVKLIACDIDGTLIRAGEKGISEDFFAQARRLMDKGIVICAASGRQYTSLKRLFAPIAEDMVFICENGSIVFRRDEVLGKMVVDRDMAMELTREIHGRADCDAVLSGSNMSYLCPKREDVVHIVRDKDGNRVTLVDRFEDIPEDILKISACCYGDPVALGQQMRPRWEGRLDVALAGGPWLDFTPANKGAGMKILCDALKIDPAEVMAFGDNYNDEAMLAMVGKPYIMSIAYPPLLARFPNHTDRVEDVLKTL